MASGTAASRARWRSVNRVWQTASRLTDCDLDATSESARVVGTPSECIASDTCEKSRERKRRKMRAMTRKSVEKRTGKGKIGGAKRGGKCGDEDESVAKGKGQEIIGGAKRVANGGSRRTKKETEA
eukprot:6173774-Pleurochrysis_carterae.AAC.5